MSTSLLSLASRPTRTRPARQTPRAAAPAPDPQPTQAERLLDSATVVQLAGRKMSSGETITISSDGKTVLEIHKEGLSGYDRFRSFASDTFHASAAQVSDIVGQDPAFAFKESALGVKDQVFAGIPSDLQTVAEKGFLPMIRVVALGLDGKKALETYKSKSASVLDKVVDGAHLATDVAGLGGAIGFAIPAVGAGVATALTVAGLVGDVGAYGYHVMMYFHNRGLPLPDPGQPTDPSQPTPPSKLPQPRHA